MRHTSILPAVLWALLVSTIVYAADSVTSEKITDGSLLPATADTLLTTKVELTRFESWVVGSISDSTFKESDEYRKWWLALYIFNLRYLERTEGSGDYQRYIVDQVLMMDPDNTEFLFKQAVLEGDYLARKDEPLPSAERYKEALRIRNDTRVRKAAVVQLKKYLIPVFDEGKHEEFVEHFSSYFEILSSCLELQYLCAQSSVELHHYGEAADGYEYVINHWRPNAIVPGWNEVFEDLKDAYFLSGRFDEAFSLIQRLFRKNPQKLEYITKAQMALRGRHLVPVAKTLQQYYKRRRKGTARLEEVSTEILWPKYVRSIGILHLPSGRTHSLHGDPEKPPDDWRRIAKARGDHRGPFLFLYDNASESGGLLTLAVNRDRNVVIDIVDVQTQEEKSVWRYLANDTMNPERWLTIECHEFDSGIDLCAIAVSAILGSEYLTSGTKYLESYRAILDSIFIYCSFQNERGEVVKSIGKQPPTESYENNNWIRSSFTPVFFKQTIRSEVGERIDITCPIYQGSEWRGVVRTGFVPVVPLENEGPKHLDSME